MTLTTPSLIFTILGELFSVTGRISKVKFFGFMVVAWLSPIPIIITASFLTPVSETLDVYFLVAAFSLGAILQTFAAIKRLHDINITGWAVLLMAIPGLNLVMMLVLFFKKGTDGPNRYGENPLATEGAEPPSSPSPMNDSNNP